MAAQHKIESKQKYDVKRCTPKVVQEPTLPKQTKLAQEGEKSTGYTPLISFEILESGEVANARLKRSSGYSNIDSYALNWIRGTKYNRRPGCGVIETQADVSIHWGSDK
jgi:TonB family protein